MAFVGAAVRTVVGAHVEVFRGVKLAGGASATITDNAGGGDEEMSAGHIGITAQNTRVLVNQYSAPAGGSPIVAPVVVDGTVTLTNLDGVNQTGDLEIWVEHLHSSTR